MSERCICLITYEPNPIWLDFLNNIKEYDIFVVIDNNDLNYYQCYKDPYPNIKFIQIVNKVCEDNGYINVNYLMNKLVTGWEKALYFFSKSNHDYKNIWFIEDDVFIHSEETLSDIDNQFPDSDILAPRCMKSTHCESWTHWKNISINLEPPYYKSMVSATRLSTKLLFHINEYATTHRTLFFLEALFPTLANKQRLLYDCPKELSTVVWRRHWETQEINSKSIYHPVKNIYSHLRYRKEIDL